jgi:hypothetical protein
MVRWLAPVTAMAAVIGVIAGVSLTLGTGRTGGTAGTSRTSGAQSSAFSVQHARQLVSLAEAATTLGQALEDEQDDAAQYIGAGRPATQDGLLLVQGQVTVTDLKANVLINLAARSSPELAPQQRASLAAVLTRLRQLQPLRRDAAASQVPALNVIDAYAADVSGLFTSSVKVLSGSSDPVFARDARAFNAVQQAEQAAARERSVLDAVLSANQYQPGTFTALVTANTEEEADLTDFNREATSAQQRDFRARVSGQAVNDSDLILLEALNGGQSGAMPTPPPDHLFPTTAADWHNDMSIQVDDIRQVESDLLGQIEARARVLQGQATQAALQTWLEQAAVVAALLAFAVAMAWWHSRPRVRFRPSMT